MTAVLKLLPVLPDNTTLFRHLPKMCGYACQHTGGASALGTAHAHKVTGSHQVSCCCCSQLMGDDCVFPNLLQDLIQGNQSQDSVL